MNICIFCKRALQMEYYNKDGKKVVREYCVCDECLDLPYLIVKARLREEHMQGLL